MKKIFSSKSVLAAALVWCCWCAPAIKAQNAPPAQAVLAAAELPEAPQASTGGETAAAPAAQPEPHEHQDPQTKRILYIFPNFRSVSAATKLPPQTVKDKFVTASEDSFDYSAFVVPAGLALINESGNSTPEFGHGAVGYGRYLWHDYTDQTIENMMVEFIVPTVTREDTRYYTLGHGGFVKRAGYSLSRVVITRNDAAHDTVNLGEILGAGAAAGISDLYYPSRERTAGNTMGKYGENVGIDAVTFLIREFWPDVNHFLFHGDQPMQPVP